MPRFRMGDLLAITGVQAQTAAKNREKEKTPCPTHPARMKVKAID